MSQTPFSMRLNARGMVLLEVLVALLILSLVGLAYLQLFDRAYHLAAASRAWLEGITYAEEGMERQKGGNGARAYGADEPRADGMKREASRRPWEGGLDLVTVTVTLPGGGHFELRRLQRPADGRLALGAGASR